jgi:hypothetical protein
LLRVIFSADIGRLRRFFSFLIVTASLSSTNMTSFWCCVDILKPGLLVKNPLAR